MDNPKSPVDDDSLAVALLTANMQRIQECAREKQADFLALRESIIHPNRQPDEPHAPSLEPQAPVST